MSLNQLLKRNTKRKFLDKKISLEIINDILEAAALTSSGGNIQPWKVTVVTNRKILDKIGDTVGEKIKNDEELNPDIIYYPPNLKKEYAFRRALTGSDFYKILNIDRKDIEARKKAWIDNFYFFNAPVVFFIHLDKSFVEDSNGMLMDIGAFMQTILLKTEELGLGSCPQGAITEYAKEVKEILEISNDDRLVLSIPIGYYEKESINNYKPERIHYNKFTRFIE